LANLYQSTTSDAVKDSVSTIMYASATNNFMNCDLNWYCIRDLTAGTNYALLNGTNPRDQFETVSILNALAVMAGASASPNVEKNIKVTTTAATTSSWSSNSNFPMVGAIIGAVCGVVIMGVIGLAGYTYSKTFKKMAVKKVLVQQPHHQMREPRNRRPPHYHQMEPHRSPRVLRTDGLRNYPSKNLSSYQSHEIIG
ncbi:hypothetical protein HK100_008402, partial [Physocladia obscura]